MDAAQQIARSVAVIAVLVGIWFLHWAKEIMVPCAIALLLADILMPAVRRLVRWRVPDAGAVTIVSVTAAGLFLGGLVLVSSQVVELTNRLPDYRENIIAKVHTLRDASKAKLSRLTGTLREVAAAITPATAPAPATRAATDRPVQVQVVNPPATSPSPSPAASAATSILGPLLYPLGQAGIVFLVLFYLLLDREIALHRVRWLIRRSQMRISQQTVDQASRMVGRYLRAQLMVNASYAVAVWGILFVFGVPGAGLLGALAGAMRYLPYVGSMGSVLLPSLIGVAVFPTWQGSLYMFLILVGVEVITGTFVEPRLYGSSTGISGLGIAVAVVFWGWMWGAVGMLLAIPLTAWVVIVGRYLPGLRPVAMLLSNDSVAQVEAEDPKHDAGHAGTPAGWAE